MRVKIFFDGGCRPNPGAMEIAVVAAGRTEIVRDVGHGTSLDAEWLALIHALKIARSLADTPDRRGDFVLIGDAGNVIAQALGRLRCRGEGLRHLEAFRALAIDGGAPRIRYIRRSQNLAGIALAKLHGQ